MLLVSIFFYLLQAFCPKHSGFKEGEGDDDSLSMSRLRNDSSVTEEERTEMRSDRQVLYFSTYNTCIILNYSF